jgi:hypothetical protein
MYQVAGWAQNWDDVLWYLKTVAPHNKAFTALDVTAMVGYVERLHRMDGRFTTDYREMYQELTGRECVGCSAPDEGRVQKLSLRKIADKWLEGLRFPSSPDDVIERAKANHAPQNVLDALRALARAQYLNIGVLLQEICQKARMRP